jgi:Ala-tRNA(Pro) deacylase
MSTPVYNKIIELLDQHGCEYTTQHHEPTRTSEESARVRGVSMHAGAKAIVAKGNKTGTNFLFIMPADFKLWSSQAKNACGEPVSFETNPEKVTGCVPGSVPPFGSLFGLKTFVDPRLADNETIHFNAGSLTDSVSMPYAAYREIEKPIIVEIAKPAE